jgi:integrase
VRSRRPIVDRSMPDYFPKLVSAKASLLEEALAVSTSEKYITSKRHFDEFCRDTSRKPLLTGENRAEDVETLLLFIADQGVLQGLSHSTVRGKLAAVGYFHVRAGLSNPTAGAPLVKYCLKALRKRQGEGKPKQPVTPEMLRAAGRLIDRGTLRGRVLWTGLLLGFGFLLRASEYLAYDNEGLFEDEKVIRWSEVTFRRRGKVVQPEGGEGDPDEVVVKFRASKTDQFKAGCVRNLFTSGLDDFCPVLALWSLAKELGPRLRSGPIMAVPGEGPVGRNEVAQALREAAAAVGESTENVSTHSLRAGGATALYAAGYTEAEITYHGRWASASWTVYVHRTVARSAAVAHDMFVQRISLLRRQEVATRRLGGTTDKKERPAPPAGGRRSAPAESVVADDQRGVRRVVAPNKGEPHSTVPGARVSGRSPSLGDPTMRVAEARPRPNSVCSLQSIFGYGSPS